MTEQKTGAEIGVYSDETCIDLAWLAEELDKIIKEKLSSADQTKNFLQELLTFKDNTFIINTTIISQALLENEKFKKEVYEKFLNNIEIPPSSNETYKIGGKIKSNSENSLKKSINSISRHIDDFINMSSEENNKPVKELWIDNEKDIVDHFHNSAQSLFASYNPHSEIKLHHLKFQETQKTVRINEVARQITSFEDINFTQKGISQIDALMNSIKSFLINKQRLDKEDVEDDIDQWTENAKKTNSYVNEFINFLEDEGLSRIRIAISIDIMKAISKSDTQKDKHLEFHKYVDSISNIYEHIIQIKDDDIPVDLVSILGKNAIFDFSDVIGQANFIKKMPVWTLWDNQLFESREIGNTKREVCYYFKFNGHNPQENKPTYEARLDNAENILKNGNFSEHIVKATIAELLIYHASMSTEAPIPTIKKKIQEMSKYTNRMDCINDLINELRGKSKTITTIASTLKTLLKNKSVDHSIKELTNDPLKYFVNIFDQVLSTSAPGAGKNHPFDEKKDNAEKKIAWFKAMRVTKNTPVLNSMYSFEVKVNIGDRSLISIPGSDLTGLKLSMERLVPKRLGLVSLIPFDKNNADKTKYIFGISKAWRNNGKNPLISILYSNNDLDALPKNYYPNEPMLGASLAFAVRSAVLMFTQISMKRLLNKMEPKYFEDKLIVLRQQSEGSPKEQNLNNSSEAIYAMSQALEHAIGKDVVTKLQGYAPNLSDNKFKKAKVFDAMLSSCDIMTAGSTHPNVSKIGIISYASRPSDVNKNFYTKATSQHTVIGRSYINECIDGKIYTRRYKNILDTYEGDEVVNNPSIISEIIQGMKNEGCNNIVLISHKYNGRKIGRSAERHRHHENNEFLKKLTQTFPDINFFPVVKDTIKVIRTDETDNKTGYEVIGTSNHTRRLLNEDMEDAFKKAGLIPFYSLATLFIIKFGETKEKIQSSLCTYYLLQHDRIDDIMVQRLRLINEKDPIQASIISALRNIHYLESEAGTATKKRHEQVAGVKPVLEPAKWMKINNINGAGEITVISSRRQGSIEGSFTAICAHVARVSNTILEKKA